MSLLPLILDGFIHIIWDQRMIQTNLDLFIQCLVLILNQDYDGHPILDRNIDSLRRVARDLFIHRGCTTDHYSALFDEVDNINFGMIWLIHK